MGRMRLGGAQRTTLMITMKATTKMPGMQAAAEEETMENKATMERTVLGVCS